MEDIAEFLDNVDNLDLFKKRARSMDDDLWQDVFRSLALREKFTHVGILLSYNPTFAIQCLIMEDLILTGRIHMFEFIVEIVGVENVFLKDDFLFELILSFYFWSEYEKEHRIFLETFADVFIYQRNLRHKFAPHEIVQNTMSFIETDPLLCKKKKSQRKLMHDVFVENEHLPWLKRATCTDLFPLICKNKFFDRLYHKKLKQEHPNLLTFLPLDVAVKIMDFV